MGRGKKKRTKGSYSRPRGGTPEFKTVLLICEGKKTEPNYFRGFIKRDCLAVTIRKKEAGYAPLGLVQYAKDFRRRKESRHYDAIWCIFDRDSHETFDEAIRMARDSKIDVAVSVPCFELWLYLHYADQNAYIERDILEKRLEKFIEDYDKAMDGIYELLEGKRDEALRRAKELRQMHERNGKPETENPSTSVDKLVIKLLELASSGS